MNGSASLFPRPCLIFLNGEIEDPKRVLEAAQFCRCQHGAVLCADGGLKQALKLKIIPDIVIGDMDSLPKPLPALGFKKPVFVCDFDEDSSDFEKTLLWALERGFKTAFVCGLLGGGLDHALVNIAMMERFGLKMRVVALGRGQGIFLSKGLHQFALNKGERFSLLTLGEAEISLLGARYELKEEILSSSSRGLGNTAEGPVSVQLHRGNAWFLIGRGLGLK